jgi:hypothetical protein
MLRIGARWIGASGLFGSGEAGSKEFGERGGMQGDSRVRRKKPFDGEEMVVAGVKGASPREKNDEVTDPGEARLDAATLTAGETGKYDGPPMGLRAMCGERGPGVGG